MGVLLCNITSNLTLIWEDERKAKCSGKRGIWLRYSRSGEIRKIYAEPPGTKNMQKAQFPLYPLNSKYAGKRQKQPKSETCFTSQRPSSASSCHICFSAFKIFFFSMKEGKAWDHLYWGRGLQCWLAYLAAGKAQSQASRPEDWKNAVFDRRT